MTFRTLTGIRLAALSLEVGLGVLSFWLLAKGHLPAHSAILALLGCAGMIAFSAPRGSDVATLWRR